MSFFKSKVFIISAVAVIIVAIVVPTSIVLLNRDTIPPTIKIDNPTIWEVLSGEVLINCTAGDTGSDNSEVQLIELYLNDTLISSSVPYLLDTTQYSDGPYNLKAIAYDLVNLTAETEIQITIDNFVNPAPTDYFKFLSYNIYESGSEPEWKDVVKAENADIIVFVETGTWNEANNKKLKLMLNYYNGYFYQEAPYEGFTTQHDSFPTTGEAIFSRYPILNVTQIGELTLDDNTTYYATHDFLHVAINVTGVEINVIGFHLKCCEGEFEEWRREREQEGIINYMDELGDVPIIYAGDINSLSPFDIGELAGDPGADFGYGPVTMLLEPDDPIYGNYSSKVHNFTDVFRYLHPTDPGYTLNVPTILSRIDFIFVNQYFNNTLIGSNVGTNTIYDDLGSDHLPVNAIIQIANISSSTILLIPTEESILEKNTIQNLQDQSGIILTINRVDLEVQMLSPTRSKACK